MSAYQVFARKYRPQKFSEVVAQDAIVATLKNAILMQRTAHAYLFCGCKGTGKTTLARLYAKALNCPALSEECEPCNQCSSCKEIGAGHALDVLEIDGASHRGIEDVRQINETIGFASVGGRYKIYLIDEVHMLTKEAFNALLKTLEEPPAHVKFFFCTTEAHKIPATIVSRCQRFNLRRIPQESLVHQLEFIAKDANIDVEIDALDMIARLAEGSLRDALSLFDQICVFQKKQVTVQSVTDVLGIPSKDLLFAIDKAGIDHDLPAIFKIADEVFCSGKNMHFFLEELMSHFRTLLLIKSGIACSNPDRKEYEKIASSYRQDQLIQILELLTEAQHSIKSAPSERTALEMLLLQIARTHQQLSLQSLVDRLIKLEKTFSATDQTPSLVTDNKRHIPIQSVLEDPLPKAEELPHKKSANLSKVTEAEKEKPKTQISSPKQPSISIQEQSRMDTIMRFAAKELNGSLKKE